ncbi:MAG: holo-ACP synthase [Hominimerdicola sp.]
MNLSCGTDIVEVERIKKSCANERFLKRVYSEKELALFLHKKNPYESLAGNWAAKEAFSKCLKTGVRNFELNEVSCLRDELGCPYFEFSGSALEIVERLDLKFSVSISHTKEYATAVVICCKKE